MNSDSLLVQSANRTKHVFLGQLLVTARLIPPATLTKTLQIAHQTGTPLGATLRQLNLISTHALETALCVQRLANVGRLPIKTAAEMLKNNIEQNTSAKNAWSKQINDRPIFDLLVQAGVVPATNMAVAKVQSELNQMPLCRYLVIKAIVPLNLMSLLFDLWAAHLAGDLTAGECAEQIKQWCETGLRNIKTAGHGNKLGNLLVKAGLLSELDKLHALEEAFRSRQFLGECLIALGFVGADTVKNALQVQPLIACGAVSLERGIKVLTESPTNAALSSWKELTDRDQEQAAMPAGTQCPEQTTLGKACRAAEDAATTDKLVLAILADAGIVTAGDLKRVSQLSADKNVSLSMSILLLNIIRKETLTAAREAVILIDKKSISRSQALLALQYSDRMGTTLHEGLALVTNNTVDPGAASPRSINITKTLLRLWTCCQVNRQRLVKLYNKIKGEDPRWRVRSRDRRPCSSKLSSVSKAGSPR